MAELPAWVPAPRPRVIFPSRWDASKGGDTLLQVAADVVAAVGGPNGADIVGLDWGDRAAEAAELGVRLIPKMPKQQFLQEIAQAHVAVGQVAGILATSELEAMGIGVPTIFADQVDGYSADLATISVSRSDVGQAAREALADPVTTSQKLQGPEYIRVHHGAAGMIPTLEAGYAKVLGRSA